MKKHTENTTHNALKSTAFHHTVYSFLFDGLYLYRCQHSGDYNVFSETLLITNEEQGDLVKVGVAQKHLIGSRRWNSLCQINRIHFCNVLRRFEPRKFNLRHVTTRQVPKKPAG